MNCIIPVYVYMTYFNSIIMLKSIKYVTFAWRMHEKILFYNDKNVIHRQLKQARLRCGLSQSELAVKMQLLNVSMDQQMVSKIENNARIVTDYELACFCHILGVTEKEMLRDFGKRCE